jgi:hypothetical protein
VSHITPLGCVKAAGSLVRRNAIHAVLALTGMAATSVFGQVAVSSSGAATYSQPLAVPPAVAGTAPQLSLMYAGGSGNGPVGYGWNLQGLSTITRCPATFPTDGKTAAVVYTAADKLCLDGMRLIQTNEAGSATASTNAVSVPVSTQVNDSRGLAATAYREFRTERDMYARIRAYGYANGDTSGASGPAYFKVWLKSGQVYEYGASPGADSNTRALITRYASTGTGVPMAWAVSRISDATGNVVDFKYEQRNVAWGSGTVAGSPTSGREWGIREIQYSGNKVIFNYWTDANGNDLRTDRSEAYQRGTKNVSSRLLKSITTYINSANTSALGPDASAVAVKSYVLTYDKGPRTGRSRLWKLKECAGTASSTRCLPQVEFSYSSGGNDAYDVNATFRNGPLVQAVLQKADGSIATIPIDANGDGKSDLLRFGDNPANNQLWLSNGDGSFAQVPNGTAPTQFNISATLSRADGCYSAFLGDVNGDGLLDVIRYASTTTLSGATCSTPDPTTYVFISDGDGSFTQKLLTGATLKLKTSAIITGECGQGCQAPPFGRSQGFTFYLLDLDNDGKLDIVTAETPAIALGGTAQSCVNGICTHVYLGAGTGAFAEATTNVSTTILYGGADPRRATNLRDLDGDGLLDLHFVRNDIVNSTPTVVFGAWRSRGDGNFDPVTYATPCNVPIDFNGDGRADCVGYDTSTAAPSGNKLQVATSSSDMQSVAGFNLTASGQELYSTTGGVGIEIFDANGDGRQDILRWEDDASKNELFLSNGDGTFTASGTFSVGGTSSFVLRRADGSYGYVLGDFTGRGTIEILRTLSSPIATDATTNVLLSKADATPPDLLTSVKSATGLATTLYYVPLSNAAPTNGVSASLASRYTSDRGKSAYAVADAQDLTPPFYVVATSVTDSGAGASTVATEFSYLGLKKDVPGRGLLGFREVRRQQPAPNGEALTIATQFMQIHPYTGMVAASSTYRGKLNATGTSAVLKSVANVFCDQTNAGAASPTVHCPVTAKVAKPYLYQSTETGADLDGTALPQVIVNTQVTDTGDTKQVDSKTTGTVAGVAQTFTKSLVNSFDTANTACSDMATCAWVLGRVKRTTVTSSVPNSLEAIPRSAGTSPNAAATQGRGEVGINPAVLSAILSLLLDD